MNAWSQDGAEVRYHFLRPAEIVERRGKMPVAWVPLGTIEWHGAHNPLGSDTLQAEGIAIIAARRGGGLVMPPVYFGDVRVGGEIIETLPEHGNDKIAQAMGLPVSNFDDSRFPFTVEEQRKNYHNLLLQILYEVRSLGFKVCVFIAGQYPLIAPARDAVTDFCGRPGHAMTAWAFVDYELLRDQYSYAGDHAAYWETSHMLCLYPGRTDLGQLPERGKPRLGIVPNQGRLPQDADAQFGYRIMEQAADIALAEASHRLAHPELYEGAACLDLGKWKMA
jgi:creatinine amidohydrolase